MAFLTGSTTSVTTTAALNAVGVTDWIKWESTSSVIRKLGGGSLIGTYSVIGSQTPTLYTNDPRTLTWAGGTPTASGTSTNGVYSGIAATGSGFQIIFPADTTARLISLYFGLFSSQGTITATLSDSSAGPLTLTSITTASNTSGDCNAFINYQAASASQTLTIAWKLTTIVSGSGNVTVCGAAMSNLPFAAITQIIPPGFPPNAPKPGIATLGSGILIAPNPQVVTPPVPPILTQVRVPGFPPHAPIPGIGLLGKGTLIPSNPPMSKTVTDTIFFGSNF